MPGELAKPVVRFFYVNNSKTNNHGQSIVHRRSYFSCYLGDRLFWLCSRRNNSCLTCYCNRFIPVESYQEGSLIRAFPQKKQHTGVLHSSESCSAVILVINSQRKIIRFRQLLHFRLIWLRSRNILFLRVPRPGLYRFQRFP